MADENRQPDHHLRLHAKHLDSINTPAPAAKVFYEIMSGGLVWSDETNRGSTPVKVVWELRKLWAYRTQLILNDGEPDDEFWDRCLELFPNWVGFLPARRKPTPELLAEYRRGNVSLKWCLRKLDREMDDQESDGE